MTKRKTGKSGGESAGDFMEVGKEMVPGMRLRCVCRGHTDAIGRIAWSPCGRFIALPSQDKTIRIWDANDGDVFPAPMLDVGTGLEGTNC